MPAPTISMVVALAIPLATLTPRFVRSVRAQRAKAEQERQDHAFLLYHADPTAKERLGFMHDKRMKLNNIDRKFADGGLND